MKLSLQYKLLAAFMALVVLVLTGVSVGGSMLIHDYFVARKQRELTDKAYEMARMVNAYYDGSITQGQLHNFVNSVDHFLDARVWVVDKDLNLITVSEERPDEGQGNRRPASVVKPSPMHPAGWDCDVPDGQGGMMINRAKQHQTQALPSSPGENGKSREDQPKATPQNGQSSPQYRPASNWDCDGSGDNSMMGNWRSNRQNMKQPIQPSRTAAIKPPQDNTPTQQVDHLASASQNTPPLVLDVGKAQIGDIPSSAISLSDIKNMAELIQAIQANQGQTWAKTYYHPYYEENMLIVAVPLKGPDDTISGTVMIHAPLEEINGFLKQVYRYLAYAGLAAIFVAIFLAAYMARGIVRPLQAMQETAAAMAQGNYDRRVTIEARDEVGELGQSINSLACDLGEYVRQMELTDKMRRDFVANVSHELRTPLTIMHGYNQALQDGTITDPAKIQKYHRVMGDEMIRLEKLIAELLDLSQLQANGITLENEEVPLVEVVDNVMTLLKQKSNQNRVELDAHISPGVPSIKGDGDRLTQLVLIIMDNALKFTPAGGRIITNLISTRDNVILTIADTGAGILPEDLPHIWERFYKADKSRASGGTGLGLAIAKQIIELHGATVAVTSVCGEGTSFNIQFPIDKHNNREVK